MNSANSADARPPLLDIAGLKKSFGARRLLDIERLRIAVGEALLISGINGAGKSTLLRALAGLEPAQTDAVHFDGRPVRLMPMAPALRRQIVYVHQHPYLFDATVAVNVGYGLRMRDVPAGELASRVDEALRWADIDSLRDTLAHHLSGGEKQRVALARARALRPRLLLLDEPTSNLDGAAREQVMRLIGTPGTDRAGSKAEAPPAIVAVCHDRDLLHLPNVRRLRLRDGRLEPIEA